MISSTQHSIDPKTLKEALNQLMAVDFKYTINEPSGDFFYDPWFIKPELVGTVWEDILKSLPVDQGEARVIILTPGTSYCCHADVDDRWHLNLQSEHGYLCDMDNLQMYPLQPDGIWYDMNAGFKHTAANFGSFDRIQIVVRHLLKKNNLRNPRNVKITLKISTTDFRYHFDNTVSPWLNRANKEGTISNFIFNNNQISFDIEQDSLESLKTVIPDIFEISL